MSDRLCPEHVALRLAAGSRGGLFTLVSREECPVCTPVPATPAPTRPEPEWSTWCATCRTSGDETTEAAHAQRCGGRLSHTRRPRPWPAVAPVPEDREEATGAIRYTQVPDGCWVACIAGLTDIPHEELSALVPIHEGKFDGSMGTEYRNAVNALLRSRGWRLESVGPDVPRGFAVGAGTSPRGLFHAVIVSDGALWHDPHPSRAGVVSLESYEVVIPIHPVAGAIEQFARWRDALAAEKALAHGHTEGPNGR